MRCCWWSPTAPSRSTVDSAIRPKLAAHAEQRGEAEAQRLGEAGLERERAERDAAAVEEDDPPVDLHCLAPRQRELEAAHVGRQDEQQPRPEQCHDPLGKAS